MGSFPDDVAVALGRGLAAWVRATADSELPAAARRLKARVQTPRGARRLRSELLALLDDEAVQGRVLDWLGDGPPGIGKADAELLRKAAERPDGWEEELAARGDGAIDDAPAQPDPRTDELARELHREKDKLRRAREETRRVKEQSKKDVDAQRVRVDALDKALREAKARADTAEREAAIAMRTAAKARDELERERRKLGRDVERVCVQRDAHATEVKRLRRELRHLEARAGELQRRLEHREALRTRDQPIDETDLDARQRAERATARSPLAVPKGRFEDAPETLDAWLEVPGVHLLVDGYNVAKAESGFGELSLEAQRDRVIDELSKLARRKDVRATVVFDGSEVPAGISRRPRGPVDVHYSRPGEIADDHIVAVLEDLAHEPVVVVTNDRELQERASALGATIARSDQLLALIRR